MTFLSIQNFLAYSLNLSENSHYHIGEFMYLFKLKKIKTIAKVIPLLFLFQLSACIQSSDNSDSEKDKSNFKSNYMPIKRNYWIKTEVIHNWDAIPLGEAPMSKTEIDSSRRYLNKAIRYVLTDSNWNPLPRPEWQQLAGPLLKAVVGDSLIVHFKNSSEAEIPLTIHPHNVIYNEANEGVWRNDRPESWPDLGTAGGQVMPGDEFVYRWIADEKSVGVGPYHSHSFMPAEEIDMGLTGLLAIDYPPDHPNYVKYDTTIALVFKSYPTRIKKSDLINQPNECVAPLIPYQGGCHPKEHVPSAFWPEYLSAPSTSNPSDTTIMSMDSTMQEFVSGGPELHTINGISYSNLPSLKFKQGQKVRFIVVAMNSDGSQNHTVHFHGEMLRELSRPKFYKDVFDLPSAVAQELVMDADNIGEWMIHCHVEHHAKEMMITYMITDKNGNLPEGMKNN